MHQTRASSLPQPPRRRAVPRDHGGWRTFFVAMAALGGALLLALYSRVAAENAQVWLAGLTALASLGVAAWVAVKLVPALARQTPLHWLAVRMDYRVTREGLVFSSIVIILALAALNTGNNMLFIVVASMLAALLISGALSHLVLSGIELHLDLPEHIFAGQSVRALARLANRKHRMPSFSLRLCSASRTEKRGASSNAQILSQAVYFPYLAPGEICHQSVAMEFPRRGVYQQQALGLRTRFPFGFVEKTRLIDSELEAVVYPAIQPAENVVRDWAAINGEIESLLRGRGNDLYAIRAYQHSDSMRHVDWKASAKRNALQVREFTREDQRQVLLVLDPSTPEGMNDEENERSFERGVSLCASLAWHFYEEDAVMGFRTGGAETAPAQAGGVIYEILRQLAVAAPRPASQGSTFLNEPDNSAQVFKVIVTRQARGTISTSVWNSGYILFVDA